jgi:hypothetical protein
MTEPSAEIVPFGKYRGQPVQVLIADQDYRDWLMAQPWFRERWGNIYQTVINYGAEPQDSPEHNEMQVSFLADDLCFQLARFLYPRLDFSESAIKYSHDDKVMHERFKEYLQLDYKSASIGGRKFESGGWDVVYKIQPPSMTLKPSSLPSCRCGPCALTEHRCPPNATCQGGTRTCWHENHAEQRVLPTPDQINKQTVVYHRRDAHCFDACIWSDHEVSTWLLSTHHWLGNDTSWVRVELKPDLGDDFPSVLRQVNGYHADHHDKRCVIVRRAAFERVAWEQVSQIFKASGIVLIREADVVMDPR